jgi:YbbR domain-containing protein
MSFRDIDEGLRRPVRTPHRSERWLRVIFVEDWGLKLLALVISLALWYGVTGQRKPTTIRVPRVPLNFRLPSDTEISNEPRTEVEITLTGNKRALDALNVRDLVANVDVSDLKPGEHSITLTPERVTMGLPDGVRYGDIQPNNVQLRLEPRVDRELDVEVRRSGNVAKGYELQSIQATPWKVKVRGPASHVNALQKAPTQVVSVDGRQESFDLPQVPIEIPDKKVDLIDPSVSVHVEIGQQPITKTFTNVTVLEMPGSQVSQRTATATLSGPPSMLNSLSTADFKIYLDLNADRTMMIMPPGLMLPEEMRGRIELVSWEISGLPKK